jgi:ribosomal-protein-alanine N-acetyltransferase
MKRDDSMTEREERRDAYHYFAQDGSSWIAREAVTGDLNDLVALDDIAKSVPWGRDAIASFIGCVPGVFILFPSNRVGLTLGGPVGFVIARWVGDECEIMSIGVHPQYRRLGLGRMLMETVRRTALVHGKMSWILEVREHNTPALSLYKSIGFHEVGKRRGYYIDTGEAAIHLACFRHIRFHRLSLPPTIAHDKSQRDTVTILSGCLVRVNTFLK